jgi:GNAT superfamily N-acetyltransferase
MTATDETSVLQDEVAAMPQKNVSVRPFRPADQAETRALILRGLGEHFGFIDESRNPDLDDIEAHYLHGGSEFFVAELDGHIAGTAGLIYESAAVARIVRMSVDPSHRRRGIASALVATCKVAAQSRGARALHVFTEPHWADAVEFYRSQGFVQYGRDDEDIHLRLPLDKSSNL